MHYTFKKTNGRTLILQDREDTHRQIYINVKHITGIIDPTSKDNRIFLLSLNTTSATFGIMCDSDFDKDIVLNKLIDLINNT